MEPENWEKIYLQLYAYADSVLKAHSWFRGAKTDSYLEGKQPHDYLQDAIEYHLRNPEKYDPSKRTLLSYLKLHIVRRAIGNDSRRAENAKSSDVFKIQQDSDEDTNDLLDALLPSNQALFDQEIDFEMIMGEIEHCIQSDSEAATIFEGLGRENLKRREIIKKYKMSEETYDNAMKRLKTTLKQVVKKFQIEEPKRVKKKQSGTELL